MRLLEDEKLANITTEEVNAARGTSLLFVYRFQHETAYNVR